MGLLLMNMAQISMALTGAKGIMSCFFSAIAKCAATCIHIVGAFLVFNGAFLEHVKNVIEQLVV